jgi:hypothetical protein
LRGRTIFGKSRKGRAKCFFIEKKKQKNGRSENKVAPGSGEVLLKGRKKMGGLEIPANFFLKQPSKGKASAPPQAQKKAIIIINRECKE